MVSARLDPVLRHIRRLVHDPATGATADEWLLHRYVTARDGDAFAALVGRHGPLVWGVCRRVLGDGPDAEDAFQATFLVLARRAGSIRRRGAVASWLYGVAVRVARKARVAAARRRQCERQAATAARTEDVRRPSASDLRPVLDEEVGRLPEKYRLPVVLCHLQGLTQPEAAGRLGWPVGTVAARLVRARHLLRRRLIRRGVTGPAVVAATAFAGREAAAVPAGLTAAAIQAGLRSAAGQGTAAFSPAVAGLADGITGALVMTRLKLATLLLAVGLGAAGVHLAGRGGADVPAIDVQGGDQPPTAVAHERAATAAVDRSKAPAPAAPEREQPRPDAQAPVADRHRLLILDIMQGRPGPDHRLLLVGVESGQVLARADIGFNSHVALSPRGDVIAAISTQRRTAGERTRQLCFYRAGDLKRLESGPVPAPVRLFGFQLGGAADCWFAHDGRALVVQGPDPSWAGSADQCTTWLRSVPREPGDHGIFRPAGPVVHVPRCYGVSVLRTADWPRVHVWNGTLGLLEVADFSTGKISSRLPLGDDPEDQGIDPADLERPDNNVAARPTGPGWPVTDGRRYAYYVPGRRGDPRDRVFFKKVDLAANPPRVIRKAAERTGDLLAGPAAVSEAAGTLFVGQTQPPVQFRHVPSRRVRIYGTSSFMLRREIDLPLTDCQRLAVSRDGKLVYALDPDQARLVVLDAADGRVVKVLKGVGKYPFVVIPLPEGAAGA